MTFITLHYIDNGPSGAVIHTSSSTIPTTKSIRFVLDGLCMQYGASLDGRIQATKRMLHKERLVPVMVHAQCILLLTASIRHYDCIAFNYFALHEVQHHPGIAAFLATKRGQKSLEMCAQISEIMSQDYDIMSYLKGTYPNEQKNHT